MILEIKKLKVSFITLCSYMNTSALYGHMWQRAYGFFDCTYMFLEPCKES